MPKVNAQVTDAVREQLREIAGSNETTIQSVVALTISMGLKEVNALSAKQLSRRLQPDGRKQNGTR